MNLLRLINPLLSHVYYSNYCSNLVIMVSLGSLDLSSNLQANYAISFLFRLDLILHAYKIPF